MPNHVESTMRLTFQDKDAKDSFKKDFNSKDVDKNLCFMVMPYVNIQAVHKNGKKPMGINIGEHWANMTMPDGTIRKLTDLPSGSDLWGTKWGTCDVDINFEDEDYIDMSFYTAWSPISEVCMRAIIDKYHIINMDYVFIEEGSGFSGMMKFDTDSDELRVFV